MEQQIEVDEKVAEHLRDLGHEASGWVEKGGRTITFFPYSRQIRNDLKRYRRTGGGSISNTEPVAEVLDEDDSYVPVLESCAKVLALCEDVKSLNARRALAPIGTRTISTLNELAAALIRK